MLLSLQGQEILLKRVLEETLGRQFFNPNLHLYSLSFFCTGSYLITWFIMTYQMLFPICLTQCIFLAQASSSRAPSIWNDVYCFVQMGFSEQLVIRAINENSISSFNSLSSLSVFFIIIIMIQAIEENGNSSFWPHCFQRKMKHQFWMLF